MIEINLLPKELKPKARKITFTLEPEQALYLAVFIFGLLVFIHLILAAVFIAKSNRLTALNNKWRALEPQRTALEKAKKEYELFSQDTKYLKELSGKRISWSEKLNRLSLDLPGGVWFNELSASLKDFTLKCSALSLKKEEMLLINKFIEKLKNDSIFFEDFKAIELSSAQIRMVAGYDITDFTLAGSLKR